MDFNSSLLIVLGIVSVIALVAILVAFLYKTPKRLKVKANYSATDDSGPPKSLEFHIVNIGRKRVKMASPFVKYYNSQHSILYEVKKGYTSCKFPKILEVGKEMHCQFDLDHFHDVLERQKFDPQHVRIVIRDTVGMHFNSNALDYHL